METHRLKIREDFYNAIIEGRKTFEIRSNDRDFKVWDRIIFHQIRNSFWEVIAEDLINLWKITYILSPMDFAPIPEWYIIFSIEKTQLDPEEYNTKKRYVVHLSSVREIYIFRETEKFIFIKRAFWWEVRWKKKARGLSIYETREEAEEELRKNPEKYLKSY